MVSKEGKQTHKEVIRYVLVCELCNQKICRGNSRHSITHNVMCDREFYEVLYFDSEKEAIEFMKSKRELRDLKLKVKSIKTIIPLM